MRERRNLRRQQSKTASLWSVHWGVGGGVGLVEWGGWWSGVGGRVGWWSWAGGGVGRVVEWGELYVYFLVLLVYEDTW